MTFLSFRWKMSLQILGRLGTGERRSHSWVWFSDECFLHGFLARECSAFGGVRWCQAAETFIQASRIYPMGVQREQISTKIFESWSYLIMWACVLMNHGTHGSVEGWMVEWLLFYRVGLNSACQAWQQAPLLAETSHQPYACLSKTVTGAATTAMWGSMVQRGEMQSEFVKGSHIYKNDMCVLGTGWSRKLIHFFQIFEDQSSV